MHAHIHGHTCLRHTRTHTRSNATVVTGFCSSFPLAEFPFPLFSVPLVNQLYGLCKSFRFSIVRKLNSTYKKKKKKKKKKKYSVTWRPTSSLSPCDTTIHLFALGPISVFVSRYTWYECAAGREKQSQNLIEKTYSWTCCTTAMTCQGPRIHLSGPFTWKWALLGTTLKKKEEGTSVTKRKKKKDENGKWRKMHRLIKKTIELFYMDTF